MNPNVTPIKSTTQAFLQVEDVQSDVLILKDGSCALVIETTATNFGLLSEKEQDAAIYSYGALLNSLSFTIQILIRSQRKDITNYLTLLETQERKSTSPEIKKQIEKYRQFITNTVRLNNVLEKKFYIIIPMSSLELGVAKNIASLGKKNAGLPYPKDYILEKARSNLHPKRDHVFRLLNRLGLKPRQLSTKELIKLLYNIYNRDSQGQELVESQEYQTPMVKAAVRFRQPGNTQPNEQVAPKNTQSNEQALPTAPQSGRQADQSQPAPATEQPNPAPTPPQASQAGGQATPKATQSGGQADLAGTETKPIKITPPQEEKVKIDQKVIKPNQSLQAKVNNLVKGSVKPDSNQPVEPNENKQIFKAEKK